jgi:thymidylate kinase
MKKPNIIIVEGIDRVGKTTLVNKIVNNSNYKKFKPLNNTKNRTKEIETEKIFATLSTLKLLKNDYIIFDRFHISEFVYGYVERGYVNKDCGKVDKILGGLNSLLIYVEPVNISQSIKEHGKDLREHEKLFLTIYKNSKMQKMICNYNNLSEVAEKIINLSEEELK